MNDKKITQLKKKSRQLFKNQVYVNAVRQNIANNKRTPHWIFRDENIYTYQWYIVQDLSNRKDKLVPLYKSDKYTIKCNFMQIVEKDIGIVALIKNVAKNYILNDAIK